MGHIDDRWHKRVDGKKVRSSRYGTNKKSRWAVRWIDPAGKEKQRSFESEDSAKTWLRRVETQLESGQYVDPRKGQVPLRDYAERWYSAKATKATTLRDYRSALDAHVLPRWGSVAVARITEADVEEWIGELKRTPSVRRRVRNEAGELVKDARGNQVFEVRPLSAARIKRAHLVLEGVLEFAKKDRAIYLNPAEDAALPKQAKKLVSSIGVEAFLRLRESLGHEREIVAAVLGTTGIRWGELVGLDVHDVRGRRLHVRAPISEVGGRYVRDTPKGHRDRFVTLPPSLEAPVNALAAGRKSGPLLRGPRGGRWRQSTWRRSWEQATEAAGIPGLRPHDLRHLYASLAIANGADVKLLQKQLGHATATLTLDTYAHMIDPGNDDIADGMEVLVRPVAGSDNGSTERETDPDTERDNSAGTEP